MSNKVRAVCPLSPTGYMHVVLLHTPDIACEDGTASCVRRTPVGAATLGCCGCHLQHPAETTTCCGTVPDIGIS